MYRHARIVAAVCSLMVLMCALPAGVQAQAIIVDHTCTDITAIPDAAIEAAKSNVAWVYGHTSHGGQLEEGARYLETYVDSTKYKLIEQYMTVPAQETPTGLREGYDAGWSWSGAEDFYDDACTMLDAAHDPSTVRVFMWSWCGQMSSASTDVQGYLTRMAQLETNIAAAALDLAPEVLDGIEEIHKDHTYPCP